MEKVEKENIEFEEEKQKEEQNQAAENLNSEADNSETEKEAEDYEDGIQMELSREELIAEIKEKDQKIEKMDAEIDDLLSRLQRLQADFVNYRKRSQREKAEMTTRGKAKLAADLLPAIDNFERALKAEENEGEFYKGVEMIYKQLLKSFADQGIEEIIAEGEEFNPEYHEAIMSVDTDQYDEGMIIDVIQKGFIIEDRVIRPAMVRVAG